MNRQFPALRGFAILLVVINHSIVLSLQAITQFDLQRTPIWERNILLAIKEMGVIAVPIFLFLAGAFMMYAMKDKNIWESYRLVLPALRNVIFPYIIWSVAFYFFIYLLKAETYSLLGYVKNLIVGYPFNFVPILVFFIIIAPLLAWVVKRWPLIILFAFFVFQFLLVNIKLPGSMGFMLPTFFSILYVPILGLPLTLWAIFYPLGMVYIQFSQKYKSLLSRFIIFIAVFSFGLYVFAVLKEIGIVSFGLTELLLPFIFILLLPFLDRKKIPFLHFFENLGKRTFGIYLMNLTIITLLTQIVGKYTSWLFRVEALVVFILATLTILLTTNLMKWVERKFSRQVYNFIFG